MRGDEESLLEIVRTLLKELEAKAERCPECGCVETKPGPMGYSDARCTRCNRPVWLDEHE
jgi:uncharacterized paraquat-inducible protein A